MTSRLLPAGCHPILLADRGFATPVWFRAIDALGWDGIIRSKGSVWVRQPGGRWSALCVWGQHRPVLVDTLGEYGKRAQGGSHVGRPVVYGDGAHVEPWYLIVSAGLAQRTGLEIVAAYGPRVRCEESYRDQKNDPHQGFHLDCVTLSTAARWDRLWLIFAWAYYWLHVTGWTAEAQGTARQWRANPADRRTHALWRLGPWALARDEVGWRTILRAVDKFRRTIPAITAAPPPT